MASSSAYLQRIGGLRILWLASVGWYASPFFLAGAPEPGWTYWAGWSLNNQLEITFGVALLVCGLMLRRDSQ
ncbi:MAG: hypothetical protein WDM87_01680 [Terracidiphilus sp.]